MSIADMALATANGLPAVSPALHIETQGSPACTVYVSPSKPVVCTHARAPIVAHPGGDDDSWIREVSDGVGGRA